MADEFAKGFAIFMSAGLGWLIVAGWYKTPGFEDTQLLGAPPENPDLYASIALTIGDALFWFAIIGALTFWVLIPLYNEFVDYMDERAN